MKLQSFEKRVITVYAVVFLLMLISVILLRMFFTIYEVINWNNLIGINGNIALGSIVIVFSYFLVKKITNNLDEGNKKTFALLFVIGIIINAIFLGSAVKQAAKWYNAFGANRQMVKVTGEITSVYTSGKIKKRNRKRNRITIYDTALQRNIKLETKNKYEVHTIFNDTLTKGSLGFLYKRL